MDIEIAGRSIGRDAPPYFIAELSGNHNGKIERAFAIMEAAKAAGADAVKLQTYTADTMTIDSDGPDFRIRGGLWDGRGLYELYQEASTPWDWHEALFEKGRELGLTVFSTPFDLSAVEFLERLGAPAYKIASFELTYLDLIRAAASTGKPLVMSTGMANLAEITNAVEAAEQAGARSILLLHCVSGYPTPASEANLSTLSHLAAAFGYPVGLSDHTLGVAVSIAAASLGACAIEKHVTLRRSDGGPDGAFSLEPAEVAAAVQGCRDAWSAIGRVSYDRAPSERENVIFRRSLYAVKDIPVGSPFSNDNVRVIRPGYGLPPQELGRVLGRTAARDIARGTALQWDLVR